MRKIVRVARKTRVERMSEAVDDLQVSEHRSQKAKRKEVVRHLIRDSHRVLVQRREFSHVTVCERGEYVRSQLSRGMRIFAVGNEISDLRGRLRDKLELSCAVNVGMGRQY